jgi:glycosyltransferase involved in cell wall biosynthesis
MPGVEAARAGAKAIGRQNRIGMRNVLQSVKALVFPSMPLVSNHPHGRRTEQFGQLLIEAMACGTPIVAYDSGAIPEVLGSELTQYCTCGDWAALSAMLKHVLTNKTLWNRLSEHNRARAIKVFSQHVIGGEIASWYSVDQPG